MKVQQSQVRQDNKIVKFAHSGCQTVRTGKIHNELVLWAAILLLASVTVIATPSDLNQQKPQSIDLKHQNPRDLLQELQIELLDAQEKVENLHHVLESLSGKLSLLKVNQSLCEPKPEKSSVGSAEIQLKPELMPTDNLMKSSQVEGTTPRPQVSQTTTPSPPYSHDSGKPKLAELPELKIHQTEIEAHDLEPEASEIVVAESKPDVTTPTPVENDPIESLIRDEPESNRLDETGETESKADLKVKSTPNIDHFGEIELADDIGHDIDFDDEEEDQKFLEMSQKFDLFQPENGINLVHEPFVVRKTDTKINDQVSSKTETKNDLSQKHLSAKEQPDSKEKPDHNPTDSVKLTEAEPTKTEEFDTTWMDWVSDPEEQKTNQSKAQKKLDKSSDDGHAKDSPETINIIKSHYEPKNNLTVQDEIKPIAEFHQILDHHDRSDDDDENIESHQNLWEIDPSNKVASVSKEVKDEMKMESPQVASISTAPNTSPWNVNILKENQEPHTEDELFPKVPLEVNFRTDSVGQTNKDGQTFAQSIDKRIGSHTSSSQMAIQSSNSESLKPVVSPSDKPTTFSSHKSQTFQQSYQNHQILPTKVETQVKVENPFENWQKTLKSEPKFSIGVNNQELNRRNSFRRFRSKSSKQKPLKSAEPFEFKTQAINTQSLEPLKPIAVPPAVKSQADGQSSSGFFGNLLSRYVDLEQVDKLRHRVGDYAHDAWTKIKHHSEPRVNNIVNQAKGTIQLFNNRKTETRQGNSEAKRTLADMVGRYANVPEPKHNQMNQVSDSMPTVPVPTIPPIAPIQPIKAIPLMGPTAPIAPMAPITPMAISQTKQQSTDKPNDNFQESHTSSWHSEYQDPTRGLKRLRSSSSSYSSSRSSTSSAL